MPFMQWSEILSIDQGDIDHQHRQLVDAINAFHDAVAAGHAAEAVAETLTFLNLYGTLHFTHEEQLLEANAFPKLEQHRRQHRLFVDQVKSFQAQLTTSGPGLGHGMAQFLGSWLVNHIMVADKEYAAFLSDTRRHPLPLDAEDP